MTTKYHRLDGPAVEWADGTKQWFIEGKSLTEKEFNERVGSMNPSCTGKIVTIDGRRYELKEV